MAANCMGSGRIPALSAAARLATDREELKASLQGLRNAPRRQQSIHKPPGGLIKVLAPADECLQPNDTSAPPSASPSEHTEKYRRAMAALQVERNELQAENKQLHRRVNELERELRVSRLMAAPAAGSTRGRTVPPRPATTGGNRQTSTRTTAAIASARGARGSSGTTALEQIVSAVTSSRADELADAAKDCRSNDEKNCKKNEDEDVHRAWTTEGWLASLSVVSVIANAVMRPILSAADARMGRSCSGRLQLSFLRALATSASRDACRSLLDESVLEGLADELWRGLQALIQSPGATGDELHAKFMQEPEVFVLDYGTLSTFFGGLDGLIGAPKPALSDAIHHEHCNSTDSHTNFEAANYGTQTTPAIEYHFVIAPQSGLRTLGIERWPQETRLAHESRRRRATPLLSFRGELRSINKRLQRLECAPVSETELSSARLYTGPMYQKYNAVLRGKKSKNSRQFARWYASCLGNQYTTTLHVINSAITKLSQLTIATTVWRGVYGGVLPREFFQANEYSVRGGVEWSFLSCTQDRKVAFSYAASKGGVGIVFEFAQGMVDRGADLQWISQYPYEREILFSPLTSIEVQSTRVEASGLLVVRCRLNVNLTNDATDKVISRRLRLLNEMAVGMQTEVSSASVSHASDTTQSAPPRLRSMPSGLTGSISQLGVERFNRLLREGPLSADASRYNDDDFFFSAIKGMLELKKEILNCIKLLPVAQEEVNLGIWDLHSSQRVETLCLWLTGQPATRLLDMSNCKVSLDASTAIGAALRANTILEKIVVTRATTLPVQQLSGKQPVVKLTLTRRKIGAIAGCMLSELIAFNGTVGVLELDHNMLGQRDDAACLAIADALKARPACLKKLTMTGNYIGDKGAAALAEAINHNTRIEMLDLSANEISNDGARQMTKILESGTSNLSVLRMKKNEIDSYVASAIVKELRSSRPNLMIEM